jgi:hypothetical protein
VDAITTRTARIELVEERIVAIRVGDRVQTLEDAQANFEACERLAAPDRKPFLADIRLAKPLSPEVRHMYGQTSDGSFRRCSWSAIHSVARWATYLKIARPRVSPPASSQTSRRHWHGCAESKQGNPRRAQRRRGAWKRSRARQR